MQYIRSLAPDDIPLLYASYLEAFQNFWVPVKYSLNQFSNRLHHKMHLDWDTSFGFFNNDYPVAFVFHAVEGKFAYNAGTGVIPSFRGQKLINKIYEIALPKLKTKEIANVSLEVLDQNIAAQKTYQSIGFKKTDELLCFIRINQEKSISIPSEWSVFSPNTPHLGKYQEFDNEKVVFLDDFGHLKHNIYYEKAIEIAINGILVGYILFQPENGRISRFYVDYALKDPVNIGQILVNHATSISKNPNLTIMNIFSENRNKIDLLLQLGFKNEFNQWEMKWEI